MAMQEIEKLSLLFAVLDKDVPFYEEIIKKKINATSITDIRKKTGIHFETIKKYLEFIQSSQELSFLINIIKRKNSSLVLKFPNNDSNKMLNIKIDALNQQVSEINKKLGQIAENLNRPTKKIKNKT